MECIFSVGIIVILFNRDSIGFNIFYTFYDFFKGLAFYLITLGYSIFDKFLNFDVELFFKRWELIEIFKSLWTSLFSFDIYT